MSNFKEKKNHSAIFSVSQCVILNFCHFIGRKLKFADKKKYIYIMFSHKSAHEHVQKQCKVKVSAANKSPLTTRNKKSQYLN